MSVENMTVKFAKKQHFAPTPLGATSSGSNKGIGSLVMGEGPKRFFAPSRGVPEEYKASCRMIEPIHRSNEAPVRVPFPKASHLEFTSFVRDRDRRHFGESAMPSVTSRKDQELNWTTKKTVLCENNNQPCHGLKSEEYSLESIFDRKQRVSDTNLGKKRNYIPASSLGDKPYTGPERSPGFYKEGGLIAGSSIIQRTKTSCVPKAATSSNVSSRSLKSLTAHEKRELENINADITSIGTLTSSYYKRGQQQPSWEEKTGMWLCRPENEED